MRFSYGPWWACGPRLVKRAVRPCLHQDRLHLLLTLVAELADPGLLHLAVAVYQQHRRCSAYANRIHLGGDDLYGWRDGILYLGPCFRQGLGKDRDDLHPALVARREFLIEGLAILAEVAGGRDGQDQRLALRREVDAGQRDRLPDQRGLGGWRGGVAALVLLPSDGGEKDDNGNEDRYICDNFQAALHREALREL